MGRLDKQLIDLNTELLEAKSARAFANVESLQQQIKAREKQILPIYTQIGTKFAELHDTSSRMAAKGVIKEVVDWGNSQSFFYKRLNRRVAEGTLIKTVRDAAGDQLSYKAALDMIKNWFTSSGINNTWLDDEAFFAWKSNLNNYHDKLQELPMQKVTFQLMQMSDSTLDLQALPRGLDALLHKWNHQSRSSWWKNYKRAEHLILADIFRRIKSLNLMAKQDMSELGFGKEPMLEDSPYGNRI
ncbi:Acetyl-CoA carboxylase [Heracleum sosnowskyi]|uniref:Acetyl-CoA carboxylase n=1 Tax=Heracleum sosnowskyi TaxID=360622 RepID=A0AAD8MWT0_9APIA|nr:Acetyl-CoA carboxylase [Heracleum sosnowskyi]